LNTTLSSSSVLVDVAIVLRDFVELLLEIVKFLVFVIDATGCVGISYNFTLVEGTIGLHEAFGAVSGSISIRFKGSLNCQTEVDYLLVVLECGLSIAIDLVTLESSYILPTVFGNPVRVNLVLGLNSVRSLREPVSG